MGGAVNEKSTRLGDEARRGQIDTSGVDGVVEKQAVVGPRSPRASAAERRRLGRMGEWAWLAMAGRQP